MTPSEAKSDGREGGRIAATSSTGERRARVRERKSARQARAHVGSAVWESDSLPVPHLGIDLPRHGVNQIDIRSTNLRKILLSVYNELSFSRS